MLDDDFLTFWRSHYGDCPPAGFLLLETFPERWFRIHSLPESRRYAETAREMSALLARHNAVATDVLGDGAPCVVVTRTEYNPRVGRAARGSVQFARLGLKPLVVVTANNPKDTGAGWSIPLAYARLDWKPGALDDVLADVANALLGPFLVASEATGRVYAPYDGGADLFLGSPAERDEFRSRYTAWLPSHPSGL
jgi:hypothetical protein